MSSDYSERSAVKSLDGEWCEAKRWSQFNNILTLLTDPTTRDKIFSIADALIVGKPVITSGGGGGPESDSNWDGK